MGINGAQFANKCANVSSLSLAANGFFGLFYQWNRSACRACCIAPRHYGTRPLFKASRQSLKSPRATYSSAPRFSTPINNNAPQPETTSQAYNSSKNSSEADPIPSLVRKVDSKVPRDYKISKTIRKVNSHNPSTNETALSSSIRTIMRKIPHSVVVVTTAPPSNIQKRVTLSDEEPVRNYKGMTLSSFSTLTLSPEPIITFNIRKPSRTLDTLKKSRQFLLHLLSGDSRGASIADAFTRGNAKTVARSSADRQNHVATHDPFSGLKIKELRTTKRDGIDVTAAIALPKILGKGVKTILHCEVEERESPGFLSVGDHVVVFARVLGVVSAGFKKASFRDGEFGLGYVDGAYRGVGGVLSPSTGKQLEDLDVERLEEAEVDGRATR